MSDAPLFSPDWHRVRDVRARLAGDVEVARHVYRGRVSWVLQRRTTGSVHRLDAAAFALVDRLDGHRSVGEIWERAIAEHDHEAPTQDEWTDLLSALQVAELLEVDGRVSTGSLLERRENRRRRERRERRLNPLYLRFALFDPDALLTRLAPLSRWLFSRSACYGWLALLLTSAFVLLLDGARLAQAVAEPSFPSPRTALLFVLLYPPLKLLHELAHGLAVKRCGGEVHECGIAMMVLMPLPYVDASASAAFASKSDRLLVGAAGLFVELGFAAVGGLLWAQGSGLVAEVGLVLLLLGGVSTLLVNGNPLLRFDGYYLLADWLEIPNLASRSRRAVLGRLRALLSGEPERQPIACDDRRERAWLLGYGVASGLYRTALLLWIAWWLSGRFLLLGIALAGFAVYTSVLLPFGRGVRAVGRDPALRGTRPLALLVGVPLALIALLAGLPLPHASVSRGVVWLPDEAVVRAPGACEISAAPVRPGTGVRAGDLLFVCTDPEWPLKERELLARADELDARGIALMVDDPASHAALLVERQANDIALAEIRDRIAAGRQVAALDGRFDALGSSELAGRALTRGDIAGYVVPPGERTVRVALNEQVMGRVEAMPGRIELRLPTPVADGRLHPTSISKRTPRPSRELPSAALGTLGGGVHPVAPGGDGRRVLEPLFDLELRWPTTAGTAPVGSHVDVRFVHPPTPLGSRLTGALRRAFDKRT